MADRDWGGDGTEDRKAVPGDAPVPGFIPWIFAVEDRDPGWWERQGSNPKRMGELSQAAFLVKAQSLGFGVGVALGATARSMTSLFGRDRRGDCCGCRLRLRAG